MPATQAPSSTAATGLASLPGKLPWWGWLVAGGLILWGAGGSFKTPIVLILVAALIYQFTALSK